MVVHMTCLIAKRDDVSLDEFNAYWSEHHSKTFLGNPAAKKHLLRYSQIHLDTSLTSALQKEEGTQAARYDGIAQFWAETKEDLLAVFASEYYREVVVEDEKKFMKVPTYELYVGEVQDCWIKDGQ
ncbi:EthD domain-containing protein [Paraphoma chrysanthemicola]|uniref:EthD domain-containing protein n=1 Tax=Paraphoma chrysanthemicola TaxID=798071 RepID=A0A8K0QWI1_9PLEO|nr:EthD domain-containing protein [Paraphoma chrysanthemicola]